MARRKSFTSTMIQIQRDVERQRREQERQRTAAIKAQEKAVKAAQRAAAAQAKERKALHIEARIEEAAAAQAELTARIDELGRLLSAALDVDDFADPNQMKEAWQPKPFDPGPLAKPHSRPDPYAYPPGELSALERLVPGAKAKHAKRVADAQVQYERDLIGWQSAEQQRQRQLEASKNAYDKSLESERQRITLQHAEIDKFVASLLGGDPEAVTEYFGMVLEASVWPDGFPQSFLLAHDPSSQLLGVDYTLPSMNIVPTVKAYKYVKTRDEIAATAESATKQRSLYKAIVTQSPLRILHEIFASDHYGLIETIALNCFVNAVDPSTGQPTQPCILSVRTTKEKFTGINLAQVDPEACLKGLSAAVSTKPSDLVPVRPVVELRMIDARFVQEQDVLSELDQRPNLMDLSPAEFETLITDLFLAMGLESRQTQASRDGGVDCVAYDPRPIFGGKVVIQAKRYKNTVGVAAVRDLYGTVQNEGASKGILVTTSGYGKASYDFAEGKPLELLSGPNLLYLLEEYADVKARITIPTDWHDPTIDLTDLPASTTDPPPAPSVPGTSPQREPFPQPRSGRS